MSHTVDPLERLRAANPIPTMPTTDWARIRERLHNDGGEPRERRSWPSSRLIAGAGSAAMLALVAIVAIVAVLMSGELDTRGASTRTQPAVSRCGYGTVCSRLLHRATPAKGRTLTTSAGLVPLAGLGAKPVAARSCSVIGPRCVHGCAVPVASLTRSLHRLPGGGCSTKTSEQPCLEDIAGAGATVNMHPGAAVNTPSCGAPSLRLLDKRLFKPFPHRTSRRP
jgi:hypothetical protein